MPHLEVLVRELVAVYRYTSSAIPMSEVTTLGHEPTNYPMEMALLVGISLLVISCTQRSEVLSSLWYHVLIEL